MVVVPGVGASDNLGCQFEEEEWEKEGGVLHHDCYVLIVDAVVVYGRLKEVGVFLQPGEELVKRAWMVGGRRGTILEC